MQKWQEKNYWKYAGRINQQNSCSRIFKTNGNTFDFNRMRRNQKCGKPGKYSGLPVRDWWERRVKTDADRKYRHRFSGSLSNNRRHSQQSRHHT